MNILITGICGFVGSTLAEALLNHATPGSLQITGIDNFSRNGSWLNRDRLQARGIRILHGDIRTAADLEAIGPFDWVIDAAANPSVLAGIDGKSSSRQLVENNLGGTINLLESCKSWQAGFILLSTSRVYSIPPLAGLEVEVHNRAYRPDFSNQEQRAKNNELPGFSLSGITETFSTAPPVSLYGSTKITSELLALEYGLTFDLPVWINCCGVMAGARQFGKPGQGIFAFWIHSWREGRPLKYIGFDGLGHQVRDCLHPRDLAPLILKQVGLLSLDRANLPAIAGPPSPDSSFRPPSSDHQPRRRPHLRNVPAPTLRLVRRPLPRLSHHLLTDHCSLGTPVASRPFDLPWVVLDHTLASETWDWQPATPVESILEEITQFAETSPEWIASCL